MMVCVWRRWHFNLFLFVSVTTKTSVVHHGGGSSRPETSTVSVWCPDQQRLSLLVSASPRRPVTPGGCPPRVSARLIHSTGTFFFLFGFLYSVCYLIVHDLWLWKSSSNTKVKSSSCAGRWEKTTAEQERLLRAVLWPCLLFSPTLWRLLCSPLWGAGWQSWRHVFGLVSRSDMPQWRFWACWPCVFLLIFFLYSLLFTWSLPTTVLLYLSSSSWPLTLSPVFSLTLPLYSLSDIKLQGFCFAELQNSHCVQSPCWCKARGSSYGLGPMLAGLTLEVAET